MSRPNIPQSFLRPCRRYSYDCYNIHDYWFLRCVKECCPICADIERYAGPSFWDQKILTFTRLENVEWIASRVPNLAINTSFMIFAAFGLAFNIVTRCAHTYSPPPSLLMLWQLHQRIQSSPRFWRSRGQTFIIPNSVPRIGANARCMAESPDFAQL